MQVKEEIVQSELNRELETADTQIYTFDAEASPQDKAKQALKASEGAAKSLGSTVGGTTTVKAVATDIGTDQTAGEIEVEKLSNPPLPGSIPSEGGSIPEIPEWARVGWQRVQEITTDADKDFFDEILSDLYFGKLWINAAVVFVSVFFTYITTSLGGGIGWVIIICAFVGTYFKSSVQRFYRNARSDISRELSKEKLEIDEESADWLNEFLRRFWLIYEPVLSATIVQTVDGVLAASTPSFLDSIRLTTFTLGSKPVIIESVRSYPKSDDDVVVMDWRISFIPNDLVNMTRAQLSKKVNPKIVLTIRVGRGMVGAGIPVLLEDMSFSGLIRVKLKLMNAFPHMKTVDISFLEEPKFDYVLKPIGGETFGFDIANLPGLSPFILDQLHATLRPMMYAPNVFTLDTELLIGGYPIDSAIGVLKLNIHSARGLRNADRFGSSDPYVKLAIHGNQELAKTKVIEDSVDPIWNETHFLILSTLNEVLRLELWDFNGLSKDKPLGIATFELKTLLTNPDQENTTSPVLYEGKPHGEIQFDAIWYPVAEINDEEPLESNVGVLRFNIHQAKDLDPGRSIVGQYNPYAELLLNGRPVFKTKTLRRTNNPVWEEPVEMFITNKARAKITIIVRDGRDLAADPIVGKWESTLDRFLENMKERMDWFNVTEANSGKLRLTCLWKPVIMDHIPGHNGYVEPCGFVRLHVKRGEELKNIAKLRGKPDPYVSVFLDSNYRGRTDKINDNLNPVWDEVFYIPVHSTKETLIFQVWDYEHNAKDKRLGFTKLEISKLINQREDGTIEAAESIDTTSPVLLNDEPKGSIDYSAAFYPTVKEKKVISSTNVNKEITEDKGSENINILEYPKLEKKDTCVEVIVDEGLFPVFTTKRCKQANPEYNDVTDVFIKELDFSKICFQVRYYDNKNPLGVAEIDVSKFLDNCSKSSPEEGVDIPLSGINNASLNVYARYVPIKYTVQPSESINNMGEIQITATTAENIPAADRAGTSDPFIIFTLNNEKVYRTRVVKKTCSPEFNEEFMVKVLSRSADVLEAEMFDWNQIGNATKIASCKIQIDDLPLFERAVKNINLQNELDNSKPGGILNLHIVFRPALLSRRRQTSGVVTKTLTGIGSGVGNVVAGGTSFVGSGVNLVGSGANTFVSGAGNMVGSGFGLLKKPRSNKSDQSDQSEKSEKSDKSEENVTSRSIDFDKENAKENRTSLASSTESLNGEAVILTLHIIEAKDLIAADSGGTSDPYVRVKFNKKDIFKTAIKKKTLTPTWEEKCTININDPSATINLSVRDHNAMSKDVDIGSYDLNVQERIQPGAERDFWVNLEKGDQGKLHIKLEFNGKESNASSKGSFKIW
ncbi:9112_t:CDS:10 [Funneliformis mosseae]|uniref:9112_t:CDS:1 n=1 Tax=Funneliformis mosseae TaxID=27381 RepID=A0A9N8VBS7_FUNMO|nr:9112_t:CDS:10 [Funneliformis mosseae]